MSEARFMEINVGAKINTFWTPLTHSPADMQSVSKQIYQSLIREAVIFVFFFSVYGSFNDLVFIFYLTH